jgi:hypothetical protein
MFEEVIHVVFRVGFIRRLPFDFIVIICKFLFINLLAETMDSGISRRRCRS